MIDTPASPLAGLAAATGARDPEKAFDRFWKVFPRKHHVAKAEAAWEKLNPDTSLAERIIEAASLWAAHYEQHPVDKKWMPEPKNWLADRRWLEDLPSVYVDAKQAAIARKVSEKSALSKNDNTDIPVADNDNDDAPEWIGEISAFVMPGRHEFKIADAQLKKTTGRYGDNTALCLKLDMLTGDRIAGLPHTLRIQDDDPQVQARDVARFERLGEGVEMPEDLIGRTFFATVTRAGYVEYERAA